MKNLVFVCATAGVVFGLGSFASFAVTVKNLDTEPRALTIRENDAVNKRTISPSESAEGLCSSPCQIETPDGYVYDFDGGEYVTIEEGVLEIEDALNAAR